MTIHLHFPLCPQGKVYKPDQSHCRSCHHRCIEPAGCAELPRELSLVASLYGPATNTAKLFIDVQYCRKEILSHFCLCVISVLMIYPHGLTQNQLLVTLITSYTSTEFYHIHCLFTIHNLESWLPEKNYLVKPLEQENKKKTDFKERDWEKETEREKEQSLTCTISYWGKRWWNGTWYESPPRGDNNDSKH